MTVKIKPESIVFAEKLVKFDEFQSAWQAIEYTHQFQQVEARCAMLIGDSGNGKTALIRDYMKAYQVEENDELSPRRVIHVTATFNVSIPDFATRILSALGDPDPGFGTMGKKQKRLKQYKQELGLEMICIDEIHDLLPKSGYSQNSPVIKFIKSLMTDLNVSVVLAGLPDAIGILDADEQIKTRCKRVANVYPFSMDGQDEKTQYATFLKNLYKAYPYSLPGLMSKDGHGMMRLLLATKGNKRNLKDLLTDAINETADDESTTFKELHQAWINTVPLDYRDTINTTPFISPIKSVKEELLELGLL
ncbi:TniB family NTP-binding protein [Amphritea pacifica]|uniref:TniB family NTP-binding protein n=1 Tax=Amphritea pacifica TaxID=2811233 RepID=A0ABS2WCM5_9GAMM|nr:TniB family NTP-binding protein [Amphritea pacifica]MBN0989366.1 TniB family NTP-binding protein [Amphritea pacifica]